MRLHHWFLIGGLLLAVCPLACEDEKPRRNRAQDRQLALKQEKIREQARLKKIKGEEEKKKQEKEAEIARAKMREKRRQEEIETQKKLEEEAAKQNEQLRAKLEEKLLGLILEMDGTVVQDEKAPGKPVLSI